MPIIKSAKKRVHIEKSRRARNFNVRVSVRKSIRAVDDAVKAGDKAGAEKALVTAYKKIDTAEKKNVLHRNTAARRKSKLAKMVATVKPKKAPAKKEA